MSSISISNLMQDSGVGFGTSGARGLVSKMTDQVCYAYTRAFLQYLHSASVETNHVGQLKQSGADEKAKIAIAGDLRPSTQRIMTAVSKAAADMNVETINCGLIPSPAVALYGIEHQIPSIMVTGSHIPDDRNGIKFNTAEGEISKQDEAGIRSQLVNFDDMLFDDNGMFATQQALPPIDFNAEARYLQRYINLFGAQALSGKTIAVYQHSGVARDLLVTLLAELGAEVIALGRSETFIPVDTEAIREEDTRLAQQWASENRLDAIVSTDGDADRPLISDENGTWLRGDAVGTLCARFLKAQHVVTPVSSNTAVDLSGWFESVSRTRIGSPFVIAGMEQLQEAGKQAITGYEANGGFLIQDTLQLNGKTLTALPTRDAVIVILSLLISAKQQGIALSELAEQLPQRYTYSDRIKQIPTDKSRELIASLNSGNEAEDKIAIAGFFNQQFGEVDQINTTDGLRISFSSGNIVHLRPSGNAPELRCYTESDELQTATLINQQALEFVQKTLA
jgi:phosphomannomutase